MSRTEDDNPQLPPELAQFQPWTVVESTASGSHYVITGIAVKSKDNMDEYRIEGYPLDDSLYNPKKDGPLTLNPNNIEPIDPMDTSSEHFQKLAERVRKQLED